MVHSIFALPLPVIAISSENAALFVFFDSPALGAWFYPALVPSIFISLHHYMLLLLSGLLAALIKCMTITTLEDPRFFTASS